MTERPPTELAPRKPQPTPRPGRIAAIVIVAISGGISLLILAGIVNSFFGPASADPHGYGRIFGTFALTVTAIPVVGAVPFIFESGRRVVPALVAVFAYVVMVLVLFYGLSQG